MEIETTPWYKTRLLVPPAVEMLDPSGIRQYKSSFLKSESPRTTTPQKRFIHYDANYVKYRFLVEFYQLLFDGAREISSEGKNDELTGLIGDTVAEFTQHCREHPSEEDARELFRAFCKAELYRCSENSP
jgi:hypothetical protein